MDLADIQAQQYDFSMRKFPQNWRLEHLSYGLVGEVGEFFNKIKKIDRGDYELTAEVLEDLGFELVDVLIYLVDIASWLHVNLDAAYQIVAPRNEQRWPDASSPDQSDFESEVQQRQQGTHGAGAFVAEADVRGVLPND